MLALSVAIAGYFYYQYTHSAPVNSEADEVASLTKIIGAMMELPEGETPTLATVTDRDKLAEQPFFQKAENGDKVLIYTNSGRAILYRPSTGKIVDVTTVNVNQPADAQQSPAVQTEQQPAAQTDVTAAEAASETQSVKMALYNGSTKVGVTNTMEEAIKAAFSDIEVVAKEKAAKNDYQGNIVIDLSGNNADLAKSLADSFAGIIGTLPAGETAPAADILIIVGNKQ
ncbi:MAG: hypothetical protein WAW00_02885 [Candidatus Moraniibacteriota bacterium]